MKAYLYRVVNQLDILLNVILFGKQHQTISARMGKAILEDRCKACVYLCKILSVFFGEERHCIGAIKSYEEKHRGCAVITDGQPIDYAKSKRDV